jgi:uncharacterized protein YozE (UPF0346 family)
MTTFNAPRAGDDQSPYADAAAIFADVLAAHSQNDYARLAPYLSEAMQAGLTVEVFEQIFEEHIQPLGPPGAPEYLGCLQKADAIQALWKVAYAEAGIELLWQLFLVDDGERTELGGLLFS